MARENVELLRRAVELMGSGDIAASTELFHEDVEIRDLSHLPDTPEVTRGRAAVVDILQKWVEYLSDWRLEISEYVDADPWLACTSHWTATGVGSEAPVEWTIADAYEIRDGEVVRVTWGYADLAAALDDLGLDGERVSLEPPWSGEFRGRA